MRGMLLLVVGLVTSPLDAQTLARPVLHEARWHATGLEGVENSAAPASMPKDGLTLGFAGLVGAVGGIAVGGLVGSQIASCNEFDDEFCGLAGGVAGAAIASTFTIPLAVHLANQSRGSYGYSLAASGLIAGVGWALAYAGDEAAPILLAPLVQIISSVIIERRTTR